MKDIFDIANIDDVPDKIKNDVDNYDIFGNRIVDLFKEAQRDLSVDEITVAYYRKYKEIKTKKQILNKLYNMRRAITPKIRNVAGKKGFYSLFEEGVKK